MTRFGVDTGGTFTDVVARDDTGHLFVHKLLSTSDDPSRAIADGVSAISGVVAAEIVHGTTVATNALLERNGCHVVFVTTAGFEHLLELRRQNRPDLYALHVEVPAPLTTDTFGVHERVLADGSVLTELTAAEVERTVAEIRERAPDAVAICLLHAYANDSHEARLAAAIAAKCPGVHVTASSALVRELREYERASTTVVNAYVGPTMSDYIGALEQRLPDSSIEVLQSSGGRMSLAEARRAPVHTALSGPAGGVVGAFAAAQELGHDRIITFDMGGTSTDVSLCDGEPTLVYEASIADVPLRIPTLDIETVGAGGGSIAWIDAGGALRVGPRSAGANPGPAAYGRGGEGATVTDAHVVLGSLRPEAFLGGEMSLDVDAARTAVQRVAGELALDVEETARGILDIADANMVRAIKVICARHGRDPRDFALVAFGGAGGLHACRLADLLGIETVVVPANPGVLSASGMLHAPRTTLDAETVVAPLTDDFVASACDSLLARATSDGDRRFVAGLRYQRQSFEIDVPVNDRDAAALRAAFDAEHEARFGYADPDAPVELVTLRLTLTQPQEERELLVPEQPKPHTPHTTLDIDLGHGLTPTTVIRRADLRDGAGPIVVTEYSGTTLVPHGWTATDHDHLVLQRGAGLRPRVARGALPPRSEVRMNAIELEIFRNVYASIAEEMGATLMRAAFSPNIKERRDYSCAIFDASGEMVEQAAHIPVHLGSTPMSVRAAIDFVGEFGADDHVILNDPFAGGTHLPDITLVSPVFDADGELRFIVANRAHHADVGGISPGSLPLSRSIDDEGIRIPPTRWSDAVLDEICAASRTPAERRGDLRAQFAANRRGAQRLREWLHRPEFVVAARELQRYSERFMREILASLPDGTWSHEDVMDGDGHDAVDVPVRCQLTIAGDTATVRFAGTAGQVPGPINVPRAVTVSAVLYCFRCLAPPELPSNAGYMRCVEIETEPGTLVDALEPAAVAAGNVETSQRIVDVVFGALRHAAPDRIGAASCGSMNNVLIGGIDPRSGEPYAYYETLAGGAGAGPQGPGASAVHTHMTNTLNTPVEALEHAYPFRVTKYAVRRGSGGEGVHRGGDGVIREYAFDSDATVTLMTERRRHAPPGANGGEAGLPGHNVLERRGDGIELSPKVSIEVAACDLIRLETPGGGGLGEP